MVRTLAEGLRAKGHRVLIFTTTDPGCKERMPDVYRLPSVPFVFLPSRRVAFMIPPKLLARMRGFKLDIVHTQTEFSIGVFGKVTAGLLHLPHLHTYHTVYEDYTHYFAGGRIFKPGMARSVSRIFCNGADVVSTPTDKVKDLLISYGVKRPIHAIPTGIKFNQFRRGQYTEQEIADARAELGVKPDELVLMTVGRVAKEKSMDVVIKALPELLRSVPNVKYVSVGDGPYRDELKTLAGSLGVSDSVIFAGPRPWEDIGKYYQAGDLFVSASTTETQGIVYVEAMAAQIPLIVKRDRSVEDILIDGKTGLFFDDEHELASRAAELLLNKPKRDRLAAGAWEHVQSLSAEIFVERMLELYKSMIENRTMKEKLFTRLKRGIGSAGRTAKTDKKEKKE
jgi:1,2-diacylglycerol 3-alpha-glucosyltransferase